MDSHPYVLIPAPPPMSDLGGQAPGVQRKGVTHLGSVYTATSDPYVLISTPPHP